MVGLESGDGGLGEEGGEGGVQRVNEEVLSEVGDIVEEEYGAEGWTSSFGDGSYAIDSCYYGVVWEMWGITTLGSDGNFFFGKG